LCFDEHAQESRGRAERQKIRIKMTGVYAMREITCESDGKGGESEKKG